MKPWVVKFFIHWIYRLFLSPALHLLAGPGLGCRFTPTCSEYTQEALTTHRWQSGVSLSFKRLCRCHPFARAGYDPVPRAIATQYPNQTRFQT